MHRHALSDAQWKQIEPLLPRRRQGRKSTRGDRLFLDAVLFRAKTGMPWRDLPERFGPWKTHNLKRFRAIATRYEKTARNDLALVHVACAWLWLT